MYINKSITGIPLFLYAFDIFKIDDILYVLKKFTIEEHDKRMN